jgi:hypothetical protein
MKGGASGLEKVDCAAASGNQHRRANESTDDKYAVRAKNMEHSTGNREKKPSSKTKSSKQK